MIRKTKVSIRLPDTFRKDITLFKIMGEWKETVIGFPNSKDDKLAHNKFEITVENIKTKEKVKFFYYGSFYDYQKKKVNLNELDLIYTFKCLIDEGFSRINHDLNDFISEYGYVDDVENGLKVWKALEEQLEKCYTLGFTDDEILRVLNFLIDLENEDKLKDIIVKGF